MIDEWVGELGAPLEKWEVMNLVSPFPPIRVDATLLKVKKVEELT